MIWEGDEKKEFTCRKELADSVKICVLFNAWCEGNGFHLGMKVGRL